MPVKASTHNYSKTKVVGSVGGRVAKPTTAINKQAYLCLQLRLPAGAKAFYPRLNKGSADLIAKREGDERKADKPQALPLVTVSKPSSHSNVKWYPRVFVSQYRHQQIKETIGKAAVDGDKCITV